MDYSESIVSQGVTTGARTPVVINLSVLFGFIILAVSCMVFQLNNSLGIQWSKQPRLDPSNSCGRSGTLNAKTWITWDHRVGKP